MVKSGSGPALKSLGGEGALGILIFFFVIAGETGTVSFLFLSLQYDSSEELHSCFFFSSGSDSGVL